MPIAWPILSGKVLESMSNIRRCCGMDSESVTLFLHPSGGDQSLNLGRSTTIRTIATDEEKIYSLGKIEKVYHLREVSLMVFPST
jgi:hypothetical protein